MKRVINGDNVDTTASILAWLKSGVPLYLATLYMIGEFDDPNVLLLTDWPSHLYYKIHGVFQSTNISRDAVSCSIGVDVSSLSVSWSPTNSQFLKNALAGMYDGWPVRIWTGYMETPGNLDDAGCSELFAGRISDYEVDAGEIRFTCANLLEIANQNIPAQVVEITNPIASAIGAVPPAGASELPLLDVIAGSTTNVLICRVASPNANHIYSTDELHNGFLIFYRGATATVGGSWSAILTNEEVVIAGNHYNHITLCTPLPLVPTPGLDQCYLSISAPVNLADGNYAGFPYVPSPESAI